MVSKSRTVPASLTDQTDKFNLLTFTMIALLLQFNQTDIDGKPRQLSQAATFFYFFCLVYVGFEHSLYNASKENG